MQNAGSLCITRSSGEERETLQTPCRLLAVLRSQTSWRQSSQCNAWSAAVWMWDKGFQINKQRRLIVVPMIDGCVRLWILLLKRVCQPVSWPTLMSVWFVQGQRLLADSLLFCSVSHSCYKKSSAGQTDYQQLFSVLYLNVRIRLGFQPFTEPVFLGRYLLWVCFCWKQLEQQVFAYFERSRAPWEHLRFAMMIQRIWLMPRYLY